LFFSTSATPWRSCNPPSSADNYNETCDFVRVFGATMTLAHLPHYRWLSSSHECDWAGVTCSADLKVVEIQLDGNGLSGSLPAKLGLLLPEVQVLSFAHNDLTGQLPLWTKEMKGLTLLHLHYNQFSGSIPPGFLKMDQVELVNIAANNLSGPIVSVENRGLVTILASISGVAFFSLLAAHRDWVAWAYLLGGTLFV
jgi:hypothetical protein